MPLPPRQNEAVIAVTGASGYVGARLVPLLLAAGYRVRALVRHPDKLAGRPWRNDPRLEVSTADLLAPQSLSAALGGVKAVYYLVHSMAEGKGTFVAADRSAAHNLAVAAAANGVERIVYLGGLGDENEAALSPHLRSRAEVAAVLRAGTVPVTTLRAGVILGSGSASFEILRYLVERLPVMITPRWVDTPCQPIGIRNVLTYLVEVLRHPETAGESFDIGQEEVVSYRRLMEIYAEEAGLRRRLIVPVPLLTPRLSSLWIHFVTPVPAQLARPLAEGLRNPVPCRDTRIRPLIPQELLPVREAIRRALALTRAAQVESSWRDAGTAAWEAALPGDPAWAGGSSFRDERSIVLEAPRETIWRALCSLGGSRGWYFADLLWQLRGLVDRLLGGVGLQRGRRCALELRPGDALDFWRVVALDPGRTLLLVAEMKLPGRATLGFTLTSADGGGIEVRQTARFVPRGLAGHLYWWGVAPFHALVFPGLLRGIARAAAARIVAGPQRLP